MLTINPQWLKLILEKKKTWEIWNNGLKQQGPVHLSLKKTEIVATCEIGRMYKNPYAWVLTNVRRADPPLVYKHKGGAVKFNRLR